MKLHLTSPAFTENEPIPKKYAYTGEGQNISPPLSWHEPPKETKSFVLICDDPDAPKGTWVHWVIFNIPADARSLSEAFPATEKHSSGAEQGMTSYNELGYGGPFPPPGPAHHYHFKLYALDTKLNLKSRATKQQVEAAMKGHILAEGRLIGTYQR